MFTVDKLIIYFFIYCVCGYICEVVYCSVPANRFVNRGFLYGPYLPIYGFGAIAVILSLEPFFDKPYLVFIFGMIVTSVLEYFTSWLLEKFFNTKLWDYSRYKFNINGRVCLLNSTLFALLCLIVVYVVHPAVAAFVGKFPQNLYHPMAMVIAIVMSVDATASIYHMAAFQARVREVKEKSKEFAERLAFLQKEGSQQLVANAKARFDKEMERLKAELSRKSRRMVDAFPSMTSASEEMKEQFEQLREGVNQWRLKHAQERAELHAKGRQMKIERKANKR
jgi:uncharacterized membrane protein